MRVRREMLRILSANGISVRVRQPGAGVHGAVMLSVFYLSYKYGMVCKLLDSARVRCSRDSGDCLPLSRLPATVAASVRQR